MVFTDHRVELPSGEDACVLDLDVTLRPAVTMSPCGLSEWRGKGVTLEPRPGESSLAERGVPACPPGPLVAEAERMVMVFSLFP